MVRNSEHTKQTTFVVEFLSIDETLILSNVIIHCLDSTSSVLYTSHSCLNYCLVLISIIYYQILKMSRNFVILLVPFNIIIIKLGRFVSSGKIPNDQLIAYSVVPTS